MPDNVVEIKIVAGGIGDAGAEFEGLSETASDALKDIASSAAEAASALDGYGDQFEDTGEQFGIAGESLRKYSEDAENAEHHNSELAESFEHLKEQVVDLAKELGLGIGLAELAKESVEAFAGVQKTQIALTALTGSAETANETIEQMESLAAKDALSFPELLTAAQRMTAVGFTLEEITPALDAAGNAAWALDSSVDSVSARMEGMALSGMAGGRQLKALGLSAEDLARVLGVTKDEAAEAFKSLDQADRLEALTIAMQKFAGTAKAEAQGISGSWQELKNTWHGVFLSMGDDTRVLTGFLERLGTTAGSFLKDSFSNNPGIDSLKNLIEAIKSGQSYEAVSAKANQSGKVDNGIPDNAETGPIGASELQSKVKGNLDPARQAAAAAATKAAADAQHRMFEQIDSDIENEEAFVDRQAKAWDRLLAAGLSAEKQQAAATEQAARKQQNLYDEAERTNDLIAAETQAAAVKKAEAIIAGGKLAEEAEQHHATAMAQVDDEAAKMQLELGRITSLEYLRIKQAEIDKAYEMEVAAIKAEQALLDANQYTIGADAYKKGSAQLSNRQQAATDKHSVASGANQDQQVATELQQAKQFVDPLVNAFSKGIEGMLSGTEKFGTAWKKMTREMLSGTIGALVQIGAKHVETALANEAINILANLGILKSKVATDTTAAIAAKGIRTATTVASVTDAAAIAAANTFAYYALSDPAVAPEMAAISFAEVMGLASFSAAGGADLPNHNTLGFLHPREMVLPEAHADVIRGLAAGRGNNNSRSSSSSVNVGNVNYRGAQMTEKHFGAMVKRMQRNSNN